MFLGSTVNAVKDIDDRGNPSGGRKVLLKDGGKTITQHLLHPLENIGGEVLSISAILRAISDWTSVGRLDKMADACSASRYERIRAIVWGGVPG